VNGNQRIEAPSNARPLSDLTTSLGTGALGGISGGSASSYKRCLDKANSSDRQALQKCASLLK
jgi:hypothetical protein